MRTVSDRKTSVLCVVFFLSIGLSWSALSLAQEAQEAQHEQEEQPMHAWGKELFGTYCAACHGQTGKGDGPMVASLKRPPTDLTQIQKQTGSFSRARLMQFIDGERPVPAHGSREMPIWGREFRRDKPSPEVRLRILALVNYIESMQEE